MQYKDLINRMIAADDLHYNTRERRFTSLSDEEVNEITARCTEIGITEPSQIALVVSWSGSIRVAGLLYKSFMARQLRITGFQGEDPCFAPLDQSV